MPAFNDLSGQKFGRWTVENRAGQEFAWNCVCDCGVRRKVFTTSLRSGRSTSCGCRLAEVASAQAKVNKLKHGGSVGTKHGGKRAPEYSVWIGMRRRCDDANDANYRLYGARGIKVCDRWQDFANFASDMGPRPEGHSIERIDGAKGYSPENCRWATRKEQNRNTSRNKMLEHAGHSRCISEWSEVTGISEAVIRQRLHLGWGTEKTLTQPVKLLKRRKPK